MKINTRSREGVSIIDLSGRLTAADGGAVLLGTVETLLREGKRNILLNLQGLTWMDSSGLGELTATKRLAANSGATLKLLHVEGWIKETMLLANADKNFKIFKDEGTAVASYG